MRGYKCIILTFLLTRLTFFLLQDVTLTFYLYLMLIPYYKKRITAAKIVGNPSLIFFANGIVTKQNPLVYYCRNEFPTTIATDFSVGN